MEEKRVTEVLRMLPDTRYFERYACAQLKDLSAEYAALCCADRPDLQDAQGRIGIEVTRAMRENRKDALAFYREISGRAETVEDPAAEGLILHAAKKKIDLLARGEYAAFDKYGLYIFSAYDLTRDALARLLGYFYLMQRNNQKKYSVLFINEVQKVYLCDPATQTFLARTVTQAQQTRYEKKAAGG